MSLSSEIIQEDESNDTLLIDEDGHSTSLSRSTGHSPDPFCLTPDSAFSTNSNGNRGCKRSRGRPRGSRIGRSQFSTRNCSLTTAAAAYAAAEYAGSQAEKSAVFAAYASFSNHTPSLLRRGRGRGRGKTLLTSVNINNETSTSNNEQPPPEKPLTDLLSSSESFKL